MKSIAQIAKLQYSDCKSFIQTEHQYFSSIMCINNSKETNLEGFQAMDHIGEEEPPGRSILTFSSPFLFRMLTTPFIIPSARYCPSFVHLWSKQTLVEISVHHKQTAALLQKDAALDTTHPQHVILLLTLCLFTDFCSGDHRPKKWCKMLSSPGCS